MKKAILCLLFCSVSRLYGQETPQNPLEDSHPKDYLVALLPIPPKSEGKWIAKTLDGSLKILPISSLDKEWEKGNTPVTLLGLIETEQNLLGQIELLQKKVKNLEDDYSLLVARYNRLASINSSPAIVQAPPPQRSNTSDVLTQYLLFRSLIRTPTTRMQMDLRVSDCTRFPALCVQ